jgi:hypothetical protein
VRQKKKPLARKPDLAPESDLRNARKRRNSWDPQVIVPQRADLPLTVQDRNEVVVPATANGRSLVNGRF